ncbi:chitinase C-terminal domain-containing protein [Thaumasiovibrio sp. DFM-14]|uniref:chitinase C-terminal domain-containing protein n=1 Tax=Thaumasiovibrio sp. DFM-14 TaxID=3384792 RepID=UPI0039A38092
MNPVQDKGASKVRKTLKLSAITSACMLAFNSYAAIDCSNVNAWDAGSVYTGGAKVQQSSTVYKAAWWTQGQDPSTSSSEWGVWRVEGECAGDGTAPLPNELPIATLTSPSSNQVFQVGDLVTLTADASDSDGDIARVDFMVDGSVVASKTVSPYSAAWTATEGAHTVSVIAVDNLGASSAISSAAVTVKKIDGPVPPSTSLTLSASRVNVGETVTVTAVAEDSVSAIEKVEFFLDGVLAKTLTNAPFSYDLLTDAVGSYNISVVATNSEGLTSSDSASLLVLSTAVDNNCRPRGLYQTAGINVPYCTQYDQDGRELLANNLPRRIIGYFTSWRAGNDPQAAYLVKDIPWEQLTHINYAFASVKADGTINIGDVNDPANPATGLEWPGVEIDPALGFKGHLGALATAKEKHGVKTLISIGGWAETGGYFGENGDRVNDGSFYTMTTNADGSVNHTAIDNFVRTSVEFMRTYKLDGLDIDYEYPTSMSGAGNPLDVEFSEPRRPYLMNSYVIMMKKLREALDAASAADGKHYLLTIASPSSGYLLRGMETMQVTEFLDYVNIMTYDLHGAWNDHVGPNAALFDTGEDSELAAWNVYGTAAYGGIGYLNTDWAYNYFRGSMPAGRINIGVPYYTRGWQNVTGGTNGLWGRAALPNQAECAPGTGEGEKNNCGNGAVGIDNLWHDLDEQGREMGAGSNPMWHAKNLENGIMGSYLPAYNVSPETNPQHALVGDYRRFYDAVAVAPWLWNAEKKVFLSTEDEQSVNVKADYIVDKGIGGVMFWELAGDYNCYIVNANGQRGFVDATEQACLTGQGEYHMGNTMTSAFYNKFVSAAPYATHQSETATPLEAVDISVAIHGFKVGDQNYPINPKITFTNNTGVDLPGGTEFQFDIPTSAPDNAKDQSGGGLKVIASGHSGNNIGGLKGEQHRVAFTLPSWGPLVAGESYELDMVYYLPISGPSSYSVKIGNNSYAFAFEHPDLPLGDISGDNGNGGNGGGGAADCTDTTGINTYPNFPQTDWQGNPSHANQGDKMIHNGVVYQANWWTASMPGSDGSWAVVCSLP